MPQEMDGQKCVRTYKSEYKFMFFESYAKIEA